MFSPTPTVTWERIGGTIKSTAVTRSYGMELVLPDVQYSDAGKYRCKGTNIAGASATAEIELIVECKFLRRTFCAFAFYSLDMWGSSDTKRK